MLVQGNMTDFYGVNMLPALRAVIDRGLRRYPPQFSQIFNVKSSDRSIEQFSQVSGVGRFAAIDEGKSIRTDQPVQGFKSTFVHKRFGLAVPTTVDVVEDDKWDLISNIHKDLGWSCYETQELDAASTFNNGFNAAFPGPDGMPLFSTTHPLFKAGGLQSNAMTAADLDILSLETAMTAGELMKRPSGELIRIQFRRLVVHPNNRFLAHALLRSPDDPTTADRSVNPLAGAIDGMPKPFVWPYLTAPNAWFLCAEPADTGLIWFWRKQPYTKSWTDDYTEVGIVGMRYRKSHGWNNYLGLIGNPGQ
ncbi:MAG TPA: Mu-like prophage major head subunit gpT family protein [Bryobacteraceae bacterium]|nr:Mu-like prophage major head subunit gpT family protein [Bryobacteraceae bacterium]